MLSKKPILILITITVAASLIMMPFLKAELQINFFGETNQVANNSEYSFSPSISTSTSNPLISISNVSMLVGGSEISILSVDDISETVGSCEITISWNPNMLDVIDVSNSDFDSLYPYLDELNGTLSLTGISASGLSGDFSIAEIEFEAVGAAGDSCDLIIEESELLSADPTPVDISHDIENGHAQIESTDLPLLSIEDVLIDVDGSESTFLNIESMSKTVGSCEVTLSWNSSVISVKNIFDGDFDGLYSYVNEEEGRLSLTAYSEDGLSDEFCIAEIEFEAVGAAGDSCDLIIEESELLSADPTPTDITHDTFNGIAELFDSNYPLAVQKTVKSDGSWVKQIETSIGDNLRFNLTITDTIDDDPYCLYDYYINDTLPSFLQYNGNVTKDGIAFDAPQIDGQLLSWFIDFENICEESMYIEFDAIVTDEGRDDNLLEVTSEYCDPSVDTVFADDTVRIDSVNGDYGSIQGIKFNDSNGDGVKDCGEEILEDWTIKLYKYVDSNWILQETMVTTSSGYEFDELSDGTYKVREETKIGWINVTADEAIVIIDGQTETVDFGNKMKNNPGETPELDIIKSVKLDCCLPYQSEGIDVDIDDPRLVTFNITIMGKGSFNQVIVTDDLPDGFVPQDDLYWDLGSKEGTWSETIFFDAEIEDDFCGNITNDAIVKGTYGCGKEIIVSDDVWLDVECYDDDDDEYTEILTVEKLVKPDCEDCGYSDSISFDISDEVDFVTYKVDIHIDDLDGTFTEPIEDLQIRDNLPELSGLQYNSSYIKNETGHYYEDYNVTITSNYIYWDFTSYVMPGSTFTLEYCANVVGCGDFENEVNVTARYYDSPCCWRDLYANTSAHVEVICGPGIDVTKEASLDGITWNTHSVNSFVDDTVWFKLTVENSGYEVLDGVNVVDHLPDFLEFDEMIDDGDADYVNTSCENDTYDLRWFFTEIDVGETIEIVFTTTVIDVGIDDNHVVAYNCPVEGEESVGDDDTVEVRVEEGIHVEKQVFDDQSDAWTENISVLPGETIEWKVTISFYSSNTSQILHHLMINDTLPEELHYVDDSAVFTRFNGTSFEMDPTIDDEVLIWDLNDEFLLNGEWLTLTFETEVDDDAEVGLLENLVDVTGRVCNGTYYEGFDSATAYVTEIQNLAPEIKSFSPEDEAVDVDIDAELTVTVDDPEDDLLTVTFYDASDDSVIEEITNINPQQTVDTTWEDLEYNTTYEWYVTVADDNQTITSDTWEFTTISEPTNQAPDEPENPNPADDATGVMINPTLSVHVSDPNGDELDVTFYDASNDQQIGFDQCTSDCTGSTTWNGLVKETTYSWYVKVSDGEFEVESDTWSFTTETEDIDFEIDISGGLGLTVDITNTGMDAADDVDWQIDIENKGLIKRIDKTFSGTEDIAGSDVLTLDNIRLINIGRITVDVTVNHNSLDAPVTETAEGFIFGIFIRL